MSALEDLAFDINTKTRPPILFSVMPDFIRHPESPEDAGCARSLRLAPPPFGRPAEFTPYLIRGRNGTLLEANSLGTDSNKSKIEDRIR